LAGTRFVVRIGGTGSGNGTATLVTKVYICSASAMGPRWSHADTANAKHSIRIAA
jgi:hypothetical protein